MKKTEIPPFHAGSISESYSLREPYTGKRQHVTMINKRNPAQCVDTEGVRSDPSPLCHQGHHHEVALWLCELVATLSHHLCPLVKGES